MALTNSEVLEINKLFKSKCATLQIISTTEGSRFNISGFIQQGLSISGGNNFTSNFASMLGSIPDTAGALQAGYSQLKKNQTLTKMDKDLMSISLKGSLNTLKSYSGSTMPNITFNFLLLATSITDNVLDKVLTLYAMVMPRAIDKAVMINPLSYIPREDDTDFGGTNKTTQLAYENFNPQNADTKNNPLAGTGTLALRYGTYFFGTGFVCESFNAHLSEEVMIPVSAKNGELVIDFVNGIHLPLYAICTATFEPKRMPSIEEYRRYYRGLNPDFDKQNAIADSNQAFQDGKKIADLIDAALDKVGVTNAVSNIVNDIGNVTTAVTDSISRLTANPHSGAK